MKKITLLLVVITLSASCNKTKKEDELAAVEWLVGTWENKTADGDFVEIWNKTNDSLYIGGSYFINRAWHSVRAGVLHMDLPIALGISAAYLGSLAGWLMQVHE